MIPFNKASISQLEGRYLVDAIHKSAALAALCGYEWGESGTSHKAHCKNSLDGGDAKWKDR